MARLGELADEQTPLLADLQRAAPDLDTFFTRVGPFSEASRPAVRSLGEAGAVGTRAFREGRQEIAELRTLAAGAPAFAKPLRQFLETIDDRRRAIEDDPRAKATAPPAPDPTAIPGTGRLHRHGGDLELLLLADAQHQHARRHGAHAARVAHGRAGLHRVPQRRRRRRRRTSEMFERCNSYLGPNQPGIFSPDPLDDGSNPRPPHCVRQSGKPADELGEQRGEGQPEAARCPASPTCRSRRSRLPPARPGAARLAHARAAPAARSTQLPTDARASSRTSSSSSGAPAHRPDTTGQLLDFLLAP